ncbi:spore coat assemly protein [Caloramator quimbayensis]|uniref:Spore coat assemly protein n=1 Tax=Caloramator quimbayensis TaxID=1147123 RepID=A0A1T4WI51_9CLOT|nr:sporulation peptidase YabG [Caloramator quimbayensis]SKA76331.1 spore coat assemly protein [Caloramator quimbayensis]
MDEFNVGDIVVRKSYGGDVYFKIIQIIKRQDGQKVYLLKGTDLRILADAFEGDLEKPSFDRINDNSENYKKKINASMKKVLLQRKSSAGKGMLSQRTAENVLGKAGKVLHVDGDEEYLDICLRGYRQLGIKAVGKLVAESAQPGAVLAFLKEYRPDILVLTGHDAMIKGTKDYKNLDSYRNSRYFVEAVKNAREYEPSYDDLVIFAGACQSCYEAIMDAGANFASSPHRVLIHALDPVFICEKIAYSSISKFISPIEVLENTITGEKGIGGLQTRGKYRESSPKSPYE